MELYLIRHAQSTNNAIEFMDPKARVSDPPLTELGHRQARALADYLKSGFNPDLIVERLNKQLPDARDVMGYQFDQLFCSPMHRSLQTTFPIAQALGLTPQVWVEIHEHGGIFLEHEDERGVVGYPGKTRAEILQEFPGYVLTEEITDEGWWTGAMEDITEAYGRAIKIAFDLRKKAQDEPTARVALVSHGTFMAALLKALLNTLPSRNQWFWHYNTAFTRVDFTEDGSVVVRYVNRVHHLTPELVTS
jgi:broad specificity phosphatase PhoE